MTKLIGRKLVMGVCLALLTALPAAPVRAEAEELGSFRGNADSFTLGLGLKLQSALPLPVDAMLTRTLGHVDSIPRAQGYAGIVSIPLAELFIAGPGGPGGAPWFCFSNSPGDPSSTSCGIAPAITLGPTGFVAEAGSGTTSARGGQGERGALSTDSAVVATHLRHPSVSAALSSSRSSVRVQNGVVGSTTVSRLQGLEIADVLTVDSLEASAVSRAGGAAGTADAEASLIIEGAEIAGVPVIIEPDGISLADESIASPAGELDVLLEQLEAQGISIHPIGEVTEDAAVDGSSAIASARGPVVSVLNQQTQERIDILLGSATAASNATRVTPGVGGAPAQTAPEGSAGTDEPLTPPAAAPAFAADPAPAPDPTVPTVTSSEGPSAPPAGAGTLATTTLEAARLRSGYAWGMLAILLALSAGAAMSGRGRRMSPLLRR